MSLSIAFYYPEKELMVGIWDNLARAYGVDEVYVISEADDVGPWTRISSFQDLLGLKVMFSPLNAKYIPGQTALSDFVLLEGTTLCFGSDEKHNEAEQFDDVVYIPTPKKATLYAAQAAIIALEQMSHG